MDSLLSSCSHSSLDIEQRCDILGLPITSALMDLSRETALARGFAMRWSFVLGLCLAGVPAIAQDKSADATTFFETKIRPVLAASCYKCHGSQKALSGLRLDSREAILKGGKHGPAVVAGEPERSL